MASAYVQSTLSISIYRDAWRLAASVTTAHRRHQPCTTTITTPLPPPLRYRVEWDTKEGFPSIATSGYVSDVLPKLGDDGALYYNIPITKASAWMPRWARVRAYNGYGWGPNGLPTPASAKAALRAPGPVQMPTLLVTSSVGMQVEWQPPSATLAEYGGDGGSPIMEYLIEW